MQTNGSSKQAGTNLPKGETVVRMQEPNPAEGNSAVINTYQLGTEGAWDDLQKTCQLKVMAALTGAAVYEQLRTREQLGYIVFSGASKIGTILEFVIIVQGIKQSPDVFDSRIEHFIASEYKTLQALPQEKFTAYIASEISRLKAPYKTMTDESSAYWSEIEEMSYMFGRPFKEIEQFKKVTIQEVTAMWDDRILNAQADKKLSVQVFSNQFHIPQPDNERSMAMAHKSFKIAPSYPPLPQSEADELKMSVENGPDDFSSNSVANPLTSSLIHSQSNATASIHGALPTMQPRKQGQGYTDTGVVHVEQPRPRGNKTIVHLESVKPVNESGTSPVGKIKAIQNAPGNGTDSSGRNSLAKKRSLSFFVQGYSHFESYGRRR